MIYKNCVIFGGKGYIGSFFAAYLLEQELAHSIYLVDISEQKRKIWPTLLEEGIRNGKVILVHADVRSEIAADALPESCDPNYAILRPYIESLATWTGSTLKPTYQVQKMCALGQRKLVVIALFLQVALHRMGY